MRKTKLITLLLVITMLLLCIPVSATYDPTTGGMYPVDSIPPDEWLLSTVYHWVVRGETLQGIANRYGTNIDEIKYHNAEYFDDLANRNTTLGIYRELEHGVRLKMYDQVSVIHYVRRGETLAGLADGYFVNGSFTLYTTPATIKAENYEWFEDLGKLNITRGVDHELEESYDFWNIQHDFFGVTSVSGPWGTPLYITVPIQIALFKDGTGTWVPVADPLLPAVARWGTSVDPAADLVYPDYTEYPYDLSVIDRSVQLNYLNGKSNDWYNRARLYYMRDWGEWQGNPLQIELRTSNIGSFYRNGPQVPFPNTLPTNDLLPTKTGWTFVLYGYWTNPLLKNYKIRGFYGAAADELYGWGSGAWF